MILLRFCGFIEETKTESKTLGGVEGLRCGCCFGVGFFFWDGNFFAGGEVVLCEFGEVCSVLFFEIGGFVGVDVAYVWVGRCDAGREVLLTSVCHVGRSRSGLNL